VVIRLEIGKSAGSVPKSVMIGYGALSTTERMSVNNDGPSILSWLKIQSTPARKRVWICSGSENR
jgi:hypothetical protein